jgi:DNA repair protein RecO (recombination protein O)
MVREKDMIIEAFTREEGRVSFFAPGIRHVSSRRAGHLETLMETNLVLVSSKRGNSLSEARVIKTFPMLRTDYDRLEVVYDIVKTLRHYTGEGQGDTKLYDVVINCLTCANESKETPRFLREIVAVQLLRFLGALPDLYSCTHCRKRLKANDFSFKSHERGFWCSDCGEEKDEIMTAVVKIIRIFLAGNEKIFKLQISDGVLQRLRQISLELLRAQGGVAK